MPQWPADFDADEQEFVRQFKSSSGGVRTGCPPVEVLMAAQSGSLPEDRAAEVNEHLRTCGRCSVLLRDLSESGVADLQPEEEERIRSRVLGANRTLRWAPRHSLAIAAAVALAVTGLLVWYSSSNAVAPESVPITRVVSPTVFRVEKAPLKLPAAILVWRGEGGGYAADLGRAVQLYRSEKYSEAAREFEQVTRTYPESLEAEFYLAVSQLLIGRFADARAHLMRARELDRGSLTDDIHWYLAVANVKTQHTADALAELRVLCAKAGEYSARACAGIREIEPKNQ